VGDEAIELLYREHGHHVLRRARRLLASKEFTPELRAQKERLRAEIDRQRSS